MDPFKVENYIKVESVNRSITTEDIEERKSQNETSGENSCKSNDDSELQFIRNLSYRYSQFHDNKDTENQSVVPFSNENSDEHRRRSNEDVKLEFMNMSYRHAQLYDNKETENRNVVAFSNENSDEHRRRSNEDVKLEFINNISYRHSQLQDYHERSSQRGVEFSNVNREEHRSTSNESPELQVINDIIYRHRQSQNNQERRGPRFAEFNHEHRAEQPRPNLEFQNNTLCGKCHLRKPLNRQRRNRLRKYNELKKDPRYVNMTYPRTFDLTFYFCIFILLAYMCFDTYFYYYYTYINPHI